MTIAKSLTGCIVLSFICVFYPACALAQESLTLRFKQKSPSFGSVVVFSNARAFRIERGPMVFVSRAPDWRVYAFNNSKKIVLGSTFNQALKAARDIESTSLAITEPSAPWKKGGTDRISGRAATRWVNDSAFKEARDASDIQHLQCWVFLDKSFSVQCARFLAGIYGIPYLGGVPLQYSYFGKSTAFLPMGLRSGTSKETARQQNWLETQECAKAEVSDAIFNKPRGFKSCCNYTDLYLNTPLTRDSAIINDLMKDPNALFQSR